MVLPILAALTIADTLAMGYSLLTKGELYGIDYYVTGHDIMGDVLDWIWPTEESAAEPVADSWAFSADMLVMTIVGVMALAVLILVLRKARQHHQRAQAAAYRRQRGRSRLSKRSRR